MDVVNTILKPVVETLMIPVKKHIGYIISCKKYMRDMRIKSSELNTARLDCEEHINRNTSSRLEVPAEAKGWLEDAGKICVEVEDIPSAVGSCFALKIRHTMGKKVFKINEEIDGVMRRHSLITWTDHPIPLGKVDSKASASIPTLTPDFDSREETFRKALKALESNQKSHIVALWGMAGVGKTTMMQRLKRVVQDKKMFNFLVQAVIGQKTDPIAIQEAVAEYLGIQLKEASKSARADKLRKWFESNSHGGKNKFLIILDDVWELVDLSDIGLSPLPNQGVDFKVLLTSRDKHVCTNMGAEADSILNVKILTDVEGQSLFRQFVKSPNDVDLDPVFHGISDSIASRCQGLPIAIRTIAYNLKGTSKHVWEDALARLEHHDIDIVVNEVFKISYDNLQDDEIKSTFLLCGLFPEDFDIPTEELVRYGWGLKIFNQTYTIREARNRLNACIERLMHKNLLIESDDIGCIKLHDLVRAFIMGMFSKVEHASFVNHGNTNVSGWPENDMISSYKRISLTCKGMSEFPKDLKFPSLQILKLMDGEMVVMFPQDLFEGMEKLQVISYEKMRFPLIPSSPQCSINLRVLHLHGCSTYINWSSVGNLLNLEVLSFANFGFIQLPSTLKNLNKLRLFDIRGCGGNIDDGVLENFVKLEELYTVGPVGDVIDFTTYNCNEIVQLSKRLSTLEFQFFKNNAQPKDMSFKKLDRFKISIGRYLDGMYSRSKHSFENTLQLVTNKDDLLESGINELFEKTEVLCLSVNDINDLSNVEVKSPYPHQSSSFYNLRVIDVSECAELGYLFTLGIAKALPKLEHLQVHKCNNIKELMHTDHSSGEDTIVFPMLKFLSLHELPNLSSMCHNINIIIQLPQLVELKLSDIPSLTSIYSQNKLETSCLFKAEVAVPMLEKLCIVVMKNLKQIWPCEFSMSEEVKLKEIQVKSCDNLVNMFPSNPMVFLQNLEELKVEKCGSIEALFNIDLDCVGETEEGNSSSRLRSIKVNELGKLREVWRIKGESISHLFIRGFQAVESIHIKSCKTFRNILTPTTTSFDLGALRAISIYNCGESARSNELVEDNQDKENDIEEESSEEEEETDIEEESSDEETDIEEESSEEETDIEEESSDEETDIEEESSEEESSGEETSQINETIYNIVFPSSIIHAFHNLRKLEVWSYQGVGVVFEIENPTGRELVTTQHNQPLLSYLEDLDIRYMERMSHVWKCNWNKFLIFQKQQLESPFHNLTTIYLSNCNYIKYLFSPLMAKLLSNLKNVHIRECVRIEEVVSNRDDEDEEITTNASTSTHTNTTLFPCLDSLILSSLQTLKHIGGVAKHQGNELSFGNTTTPTTLVDQFKFSQTCGYSWSLCQYSSEISIGECSALSSVIPSYALGKMQKLQVLRIRFCSSMKEVFETQGINKNDNSGCGSCTSSLDEGYGGTHAILKLPNLKILDIQSCDLLEHIFPFSALENLGQLEKLSIKYCKVVKVIVKNEEDDGEKARNASSNDVVLPRLKSITLFDLPNLMGFFLGKNEFLMPVLDEVEIFDCPQMIVFTHGRSTTPKLKYIQTRLGTHNPECGLNSQVTTDQSLEGTSLCTAITSKELPWSLHSVIKLNMRHNRDVEKVFPSNMLLRLQKLEEIHVSWCDMVEEVFEALGAGANITDFAELQTTIVKLPKLRQVEVHGLHLMRHIWKSNQWTTFEFPNLTRVDICACSKLEHVFSSSMVGSLMQLQELSITSCDHMEEVIVKETNVIVEEEEEEEDNKTNEITLPRLKSLILDGLPCLKGFYLGKEDFSLPLLNTLKIRNCTTITTFTTGNLATPGLKELKTSFGSYYAEWKDTKFLKDKFYFLKNKDNPLRNTKDINSFIKIKQEEFKRINRYNLRVNSEELKKDFKDYRRKA